LSSIQFAWLGVEADATIAMLAAMVSAQPAFM
jgi:hypothetical protein